MMTTCHPVVTMLMISHITPSVHAYIMWLEEVVWLDGVLVHRILLPVGSRFGLQYIITYLLENGFIQLIVDEIICNAI